MTLNDPEQTPGGESAQIGTATPVQTTGAAPAPCAVPAPLAAEGVPTRFACFVTGTDTEIGKTLISSAILHKLVQQGQRACGMKPIAAGAEPGADGMLHNEDADMLRAAGNVHLPQEITTPFMLREPCAPHIAAEIRVLPISVSVPVTKQARRVGTPSAASGAGTVAGTAAVWAGMAVPISADSPPGVCSGSFKVMPGSSPTG